MPAPLFQDPQAATAIQLLQQPGEYRARALSEIANAQANAQIAGGQAWAGAANQIGQAVSQIPQQFQQQKAFQQQTTLTQQTIDANKRAAANAQLVDATKAAINKFANDPTVLNPDGTFNPAELQKKMGQPTPGVNGPNQAPDLSTLYEILNPVNEGIQKGKQARAQWEQERTNVTARSAAAVKVYGALTGDYYTPAVGMLASLQKSQWYTPAEVEEQTKNLVEHRDNIPAILDQMIKQSTEKPIVLPKDASLISGVDPASTLVAAKPDRPSSPTALAFDAHDPKSPTQKISQAALLEHPERNVPLDELLLKAIVDKNPVQQKNILDAIRLDAQARHIVNPDAEASRVLADTLKQLEIDKAKEAALPINIDKEVKTSLIAPQMKDGSYRRYVDSSKFETKAAQEKARKDAEAKGVAWVDKDQAAGINAADRATIDLDTQWATVSSLLPKDAAGRLTQGAENLLGKYLETNPALASYDSFRTGVIQVIQAVAEQRAGLRLNQAEINLMNKALPLPTDTLAVAEGKLNAIGALLKNKVAVLLTQDTNDLRVKGGLLAPAPETPGDTPAPPPFRPPIGRAPVKSAAPPPPPPAPAPKPPPVAAAPPPPGFGPIQRKKVGG